jgi:hypothetical protein
MDDFRLPDGVLARLNAMLRKQQGRITELNREIIESKKNFIADGACLCWKKDDLRCFLFKSSAYQSFVDLSTSENPELAAIGRRQLAEFGMYNAYVQFPKLPMVAPGIKGILNYVPVHGGITFFQEWWDGSVTYGFDTGHIHSGSLGATLNDFGWLMAETESMGRGIKIAARFERFYLNARTEERKAVVLDRMGQFLPLDPSDNTQVLLNIMSGEL